MFTLGGVAGYLFRPMAEAVVFALDRLLCALAHIGQHDGALLLAHQASHGHGAPLPPTRNPLDPFPARIRATVRSRARLLSPAARDRSGGGGAFIVGFMAAFAARSRSTPYLGQNFFPPVESTQSSFTCAPRPERGSRIPRRSATNRKRRSAGSFRLQALGSIVDNIGLPVSGINSDLQQFGHGRPGGRRFPDHPEARTCGEVDRYVKEMRETLPRSFPGTTFAFLPADIVSQILNFGLRRADRRADFRRAD